VIWHFSPIFYLLPKKVGGSCLPLPPLAIPMLIIGKQLEPCLQKTNRVARFGVFLPNLVFLSPFQSTWFFFWGFSKIWGFLVFFFSYYIDFYLKRLYFEWFSPIFKFLMRFSEKLETIFSRWREQKKGEKFIKIPSHLHKKFTSRLTRPKREKKCWLFHRLLSGVPFKLELYL